MTRRASIVYETTHQNFLRTALFIFKILKSWLTFSRVLCMHGNAQNHVLVFQVMTVLMAIIPLLWQHLHMKFTEK